MAESESPRAAAVGQILILHGNRDRGETLAKMLRMSGHTVTVVAEGPGAPSAAIASAPDLVLASPSFEDPPLRDLLRGMRRNFGSDLPVLLVAGREHGPPSEDTDDVVREPVDPHEMAGRVANLLRQRFARQALQRRLDELQGLYRVSWAFSLATGAGGFFGQLARHSAELVGAHKALVLLYDAERREMVAQSPGYGFTPRQIAMVRYPVEGEARGRWNFRTNGPLIANQAQQDPRLLPGLAAALEVESLLAVPLPRGPEIIGALAVADRVDRRPFQDSDLSMLQTIAAQAAVGVENFRLHEQITHANRQLRDLDQLKNDFVAMVAHDFRGPLMAIRGYADLVAEDPALPPEKLREFMRIIIDQTDDLSRLASDTFLISQMEAGQFEYRWSEIELGPFILDAVARIHTDRAVAIDVPKHFPRIVADPERLRQVLTNLINNAIKYSPAGGAITIRCRERAPEQVLLEVVDQGLGIPADQVGRLFRKFERVRSAGHDRISGTGLGLYICRLIVEGHGGSIWAESAEGEGSTFLVLLPVDARGPRPPAGRDVGTSEGAGPAARQASSTGIES